MHCSQFPGGGAWVGTAKEDVQGQPLGETIDERTNKKLTEGSSDTMQLERQVTAKRGCAERRIQRARRNIALGETLCIMKDKANKRGFSIH